MHDSKPSSLCKSTTATAMNRKLDYPGDYSQQCLTSGCNSRAEWPKWHLKNKRILMHLELRAQVPAVDCSANNNLTPTKDRQID